jgi:AcrR family transcriptional regulator
MSAKPQVATGKHAVRSSGVSGRGMVREGGHVVEMQHRRLLSATVEVVYEHGVRGLTVAGICERAGLSRRTFYEIFEDREECLLAAFQDAVEQATRTVEHDVLGKNGWLERTRTALRALLSFFDREPAIARLLIVEALAAGPATLEARRRVLAKIITFIDRGRKEGKRSSAASESSPLMAEGVVGAIFSVIHARLLAGPSTGGGPSSPFEDPSASLEASPVSEGPLTGEEQRLLLELAGPLMAMIVQPYLGAAAARRELERPVTRVEHPEPRLPSDPFKDLPIRLTYRTARVLSSIAATPGSSNKQLAVASGITDEGQISRLLARLQKHDLIQDDGIGPTHGMPRAWTLTQRGQNILQAVGQD